MSDPLNGLSVAIGELKAEVRIIAQTVRLNQEQATAEHREVHNIVTAMSESVRIIAAKVDKMEPLTDDYREKRAEARGAARFLRAGWALAGGTVAMAASKAVEFFGSRPHP